jgi:transglutaminase-like putative cysteine protease
MADTVRYRVTHETAYRYSSSLISSRQIAYLSPRQTSWQQVLSHRLDVQPTPAERAEGIDYFGNSYSRIVIDEPHDALIVRAESEVVIASYAPQPDADSPPWESALLPAGAWRPGMDLDVEQYRMASPAVPLLKAARDYASASFVNDRPWVAALLDLTQRIRKEFEYEPGVTTVTTGVEEVLEHRRGVCQDFAHLMISCLRTYGLPARYVSGYVLNQPKDGEDGMTGADASHAWVASHCPELGWVAFDPTNGKIADTEFVTLGWGREFHDVSPLRGVVRGAATQKLAVAVSVVPIESASTSAVV